MEALYWETRGNLKVECMLCPHRCLISYGGSGKCRVRKNVEGKLVSTNYGKISTACLDPIEKKPLKRFFPKSMIFSIGTVGCNLACGFCQNWAIVHEETETFYLEAESIVNKALELKKHGNIGIAYTYSEPLMWYEYILETSKLAKRNGLKNVLVTNGYIEEEPLRKLLPYFDAVNLDIKAINNEFYKNICKGSLEPVLKSAKIINEACHLEITTLIVNGLNDDILEIEQLVNFIKDINDEIPLHITRYYPNYKFIIPATSIKTLETIANKAKEKLRYVYLGNIPSNEINEF